MTNAELIASALRLLGVLIEGQSMTAEQGADGLATLNDLLAEWESQGVQLGHFPQVSTTDEADYRAEDLIAIRYNLALHLAPEYGVAIRPDVGALASVYHRRLLNVAVYDKLVEQDMTHLPGGRVVSDFTAG